MEKKMDATIPGSFQLFEELFCASRYARNEMAGSEVRKALSGPHKYLGFRV